MAIFEEQFKRYADEIEAYRKVIEKSAEYVKLSTLIMQVENWGISKNITNPENTKSQLLKVVEELGELAGDVNKRRDPTDSLGDVLVTVILTAKCLGITLTDALEHSWNIIKDRTGETVDGAFVKHE